MESIDSSWTCALQRLRLIFLTSLLGSYMRKTARSLGRFNIGDGRKNFFCYSACVHCTVYTLVGVFIVMQSTTINWLDTCIGYCLVNVRPRRRLTFSVRRLSDEL